MNENLKVADGLVVSMDYVLHVDGSVFDQSEADAPLQFIQGEGHIIPGLEQAIYGLGAGESLAVAVPFEQGYGPLDEAAFSEVPRADFPETIPLQRGVEIRIRLEDGNIMPARIDRFTDETVRLDFNHPLAGKELHFAVKIAALRPATPAELSQGHI